MFNVQTRTGHLLHTQSEYKNRTKECDIFEERLHFITEKVLVIKSNIDSYKYLTEPSHHLLIDYAGRYFNLAMSNCYKAIVVDLRAILDREYGKEVRCKQEGKEIERGNTLFGLMDYALKNKDKLFEPERIREIEWDDGEITREVKHMIPISKLVLGINKKILNKKHLLELLRITRNKLVAHFDLEVPKRAIYLSEIDILVNELIEWLNSISSRYNGHSVGYNTNVDLGCLNEVVVSYDKYKDLIHKTEVEEVLKKINKQ